MWNVDALMDKIFIKIIPILEYLYLSIMHACILLLIISFIVFSLFSM